MIGDADIVLYAFLPESLVNVMVLYLIRRPRGLSSSALEWVGALYRRLIAHHASVVMYTSSVTTRLI